MQKDPRDNETSTSSIKVFIRVRPLVPAEKDTD